MSLRKKPDAKSAEIQSLSRYEAATAAPRHHEDAMGVETQRIRQAKSTVSDHWLVGSDVRSETPVASRRGRSLFFMATTHNQFSIEKEKRSNKARLTTMLSTVSLPQSQSLSCVRP